MLLDFSSMPAKTEHNFRGGLKDVVSKAFFDDSVKIILNRLEPGASIGKHTHTDDYEVMYIVEGVAESELDGCLDRLGPGMCQYCPQGHTHDLVNVGDTDLVFFAVLPRA
ncbi:MAG: cupin domain-containing protein [Oscillospiraceae bacterium]|nr:cupin domain-containing protein [Oscillospiraceae bacterium]